MLLPTWATLSSLSDEELFNLFEASGEHEFPQPSLIKSTSVRQIASDAVMKVRPEESDSEPVTMHLVRETTTIPVPAVRRYFNYRGRSVVIMDFIPGQTLADRWPSLSYWRRFWVLYTIRRYIRELRRVEVPGTPRHSQFPGRIGREPQVCYGPMFSEYGGGPFASYDELTSWFMHKLDVNRQIRGAPTEDVRFDSSLPLVLTHLDLHPNNVILDRKGRVWLIDWEHAGFYPQWFEYMVMQDGWEILGRWRRQTVGLMAGFYQRQTDFVASIGWAILTGFLL
ncbi:kinase-like domain-containing protein [Ganoderma leucocontextum]|nr:kinase-like domain-containing protein [Ganoderma leucocontextum]